MYHPRRSLSSKTNGKVKPKRFLSRASLKNNNTKGLLNDPETTKNDLSKAQHIGTLHVGRKDKTSGFSVEGGFWSESLGNKDEKDSLIATEKNSSLPPPAA